MPDPHWYYLSFAGEEGWRGAVYVLAPDQIAAVQVAALLGINPGGEVMILDLPDDQVPSPQYQGVLMDAETARNSTLDKI